MLFVLFYWVGMVCLDGPAAQPEQSLQCIVLLKRDRGTCMTNRCFDMVACCGIIWEYISFLFDLAFCVNLNSWLRTYISPYFYFVLCFQFSLVGPRQQTLQLVQFMQCNLCSNRFNLLIRPCKELTWGCQSRCHIFRNLGTIWLTLVLFYLHHEVCYLVDICQTWVLLCSLRFILYVLHCFTSMFAYGVRLPRSSIYLECFSLLTSY